MAEGDGVAYSGFKEALLSGEMDFSADSTGHVFKVALVTGYSPNIDTDVDWADISANEESGTGYVADGDTLENQTVTKGAANADVDGTDTTWSGLDVGTPSHAVLYNYSHATKALCCYWEVTTASNGGDYTLTWHVNGLIVQS